MTHIDPTHTYTHSLLTHTRGRISTFRGEAVSTGHSPTGAAQLSVTNWGRPPPAMQQSVGHRLWSMITGRGPAGLLTDQWCLTGRWGAAHRSSLPMSVTDTRITGHGAPPARLSRRLPERVPSTVAGSVVAVSKCHAALGPLENIQSRRPQA